MTTPYQHVDLSPEASDFLELLRELGHLDDAAIDALTAQMMQEATAGQALALHDAKRAAAVWLADHENQLRPEARELLQAEWGRLFY